MRIVFFVHRYWPCVGGVETYVRRLAGAMLTLGHQVDIVTGATLPDVAEKETHEGVSIHRYPALRSPLRSRYWLLRHRHLFTEADVVQVSDTHMFEYFRRMLGPAVGRQKVFLTRHGMSCICPVPEQEKRRARRALGMAAGLVHDGEFIEKWLGVTPDLCVDQGLCPQADDLRPVPEPPPTSAVFIGRLEPDTGIRLYIEAVRILTRDWDRALELRVFGDGSLAAELRETVERDNLPVSFHGWTPDAQDRITESCFAFVDGRMTIQEAMARRRLVLSAYNSPLKKDYLCGESFSPYLSAAGGGDQLARKVAHYIDHPDERSAIIDRAYQHARTLTWARTARAYLDLWEKKGVVIEDGKIGAMV